jgi:hypothetical protein
VVLFLVFHLPPTPFLTPQDRRISLAQAQAADNALKTNSRKSRNTSQPNPDLFRNPDSVAPEALTTALAQPDGKELETNTLVRFSSLSFAFSVSYFTFSVALFFFFFFLFFFGVAFFFFDEYAFS